MADSSDRDNDGKPFRTRKTKSGSKARVFEDAPVDQKTLKPSRPKPNNHGLRKSFAKLSPDEIANIKPRGLAAKSDDKDDPLIERGFIVDGFGPLAPISDAPTFTLDYSQFLTLIRSSYEAACRADRGLTKLVSLSMYSYYAIIMLWQRLYSVIGSRSQTPDYNQIFQRKMEHYQLQCPRDLELYLAGIGDFFDSDGRKAQLALIATPNTKLLTQGAAGSFGKVDKTTHIYYETMPAPIVALLRLQADLRRTSDPTAPTRWDLPHTLRPDPVANEQQAGIEALLPNENLLGWSPAMLLTQDQRINLEAAGITGETFGPIENIGGIPWAESLILSVSASIGAAKQPIGTEVATNLRGSNAQNLHTEISKEDMSFKQRGTCASRMGRSVSRAAAGVGISAISGCFRYRLKRKYDKECFPYCYLKQDITVPPDWEENENLVFDAVPDGWNTVRFGGPFSAGTEAAVAVSTKIIERKV